MAQYRAKVQSYGVNGRLWEAGEEGEISAAEIKKVDKAYFAQLFEKVDDGQQQEPEE